MGSCEVWIQEIGMAFTQCLGKSGSTARGENCLWSFPSPNLNWTARGGRGRETGADGREREKIGWESVLGRRGWIVSGIYGLEIRYSPEWTVNLLQPIGLNYNRKGLFRLFSHLRTDGYVCYAHNIMHSHNYYLYNSKVQPLPLKLWHHHLCLRKMTLYKNAIV